MGNFAFLGWHSPLLANLGATAEKLYSFDPAREGLHNPPGHVLGSDLIA